MKSLRIEVKRLSFFNDVITEKANPEGYKIPVTVNVTRQGDEATTRAEYDSENKMIAAMDGNTALRDGFSSVGGTNMQSAYYWSSTEYNANSAWLYNLPIDNFSSEDKYGTVSYVRACLAF